MAQRYGLIKKPHKQAVPLKRQALSAFAEEEDDECEGEGQRDSSQRASIARTNQMLMARQTVLSLPTAQEVSVFDYDGEYETFKVSSGSSDAHRSNAAGCAPVKPRYIESLMATAKVRELEKERVFERKLLLERQKEDEEFPDQEKFVTAAYKQKLMEKEKWEQEDRRQEELDQQHGVAAKGMQGFYSNLLTKNVSAGSDVKSSALSAYTAGSDRQQKVAYAAAAAAAVRVADPETGAVRAEILGTSSQSAASTSLAHAAQSQTLEVFQPQQGTAATSFEAQTGQDDGVAAKIAAARDRYLARKSSQEPTEGRM